MKPQKSGLLPSKEVAWREGTQLSRAKRENVAKTKLTLYRAIKSLVDYIEPNKGMNDEQIKEAVNWLLEDYWNLKLEEVLVILHWMKKEGKYFERLKYPEIKQRIDEYLTSEERAKRIEQWNLRHKKLEMDDRTLPTVDYEAYKKRVEDIKSPKKSKKAELSPERAELSRRNNEIMQGIVDALSKSEELSKEQIAFCEKYQLDFKQMKDQINGTGKV